MEDLVKNTFISILIATGLIFLVVHFASPTQKEKDRIREEMASKIYSSQVIFINQCNFTHQFDNQMVKVTSTYPLKIEFNNNVYLYPGTWTVEYNGSNVVLKSTSWYCVGTTKGVAQ